VAKRLDEKTRNKCDDLIVKLQKEGLTLGQIAPQVSMSRSGVVAVIHMRSENARRQGVATS